MTSIVIWPNYEVPGRPAVWVAGDSRISRSEGGILIEDGAKLLGLPVVCRAPGEDNFFSEIYFAHSFGYCFAGSTLMGQNAYLAIAPLLTTLVSPERYVPSMEDIATFVFTFLRRTFDAFKVRAAAGAFFETALFGWCHVKKSLEIWHFRPDDSTGIWEMTVKRVADIQRGTFLYLGSYKDRVVPLLQQAMATDNALQRAPRQIVQNLIRDDSFPAIGGDEQLAIANEYGFQAYTLAKPVEPGKPQGHLTYLGIELTNENASVGRTRVGGPGMA